MVNAWGAAAGEQDRIRWLIANPDFRFKPATITEFLGPGYLDLDPLQNSAVDPRSRVRPGIKKALVSIFGTEVDPVRISVARRALMTGGIGIGKTTFASIALAYMVHWVLCLKDPQRHFGLMAGSRIAFMMMSTKGSQAAEVLFADIKARVANSEWFQKNSPVAPEDRRRTSQLRFPKNVWVIPGNSQETTFEGYNILGGILDEGDCVDTETEILTAEGWKRHDELEVGDDVMTLNHETGMSEWHPCEEVRVFPAAPRQVIDMEGKEFSSRTTPNHRWPVVRPRERQGLNVMDRVWTTTDQLGFRDRIARAAMPSDLPTSEKYSDSLVELVAWFYTEGHDREGEGRAAWIYQSPKNAENCERIRAALHNLFGPPVDSFPRQGRAHDGIPRWRERHKVRDAYWGNCVEFVLSSEAGRIVQEHAPGRVPTHAFLRSLTQAQLELFIKVSLLGDNNGVNRFAQKDRAAAEAYAFACILSGRPVSIRPHPPTSTCPSVMWNVYSSRKRHHAPVYAACKAALDGSSQGMKITSELYDGVIWCPRVRNGSWLARRNGSVYFTGNSHKVTETKDYAEAGWDTIENRISSRFTDLRSGDHRGLIIAIGQMKKADGFMSRKKRELEHDVEESARKGEPPRSVVVSMTLWESHGWGEYRNPKTGKVPVFYYDKARRKIVPPGPAGLLRGHENVIAVPKVYSKNFQTDPVKALRDLAGIPPEVEDPFISLTDRVDEAMERYDASHPDLLVPVGSNPVNPPLSDLLLPDGPVKRVIHVDIGYSQNGDALGMAMGHIREVVEVDGELKPYIVFDMLLRMRAGSGSELMLADFRKVIYELRDERRFNIGVVTFDGFQSQDSKQILRQKRFNTDEVSVDRSKGPYEDLREAINERRVEFPRYMVYMNKGDTEKVCVVRKELLELTDTGRKIDHPPKGSKDVADAMAGVVHVLMGNATYRRGARAAQRATPLHGDPDLSAFSDSRREVFALGPPVEGQDHMLDSLVAKSGRGPMGLPPLERLLDPRML